LAWAKGSLGDSHSQHQARLRQEFYLNFQETPWLLDERCISIHQNPFVQSANASIYRSSKKSKTTML